MLARLESLDVVFWEASVDVGPTMRARSANAEFFARLSVLETLFEGMKVKENRRVGAGDSTTTAVLVVPVTSGIPAASLPMTDARTVDSIATFCFFEA